MPIPGIELNSLAYKVSSLPFKITGLTIGEHISLRKPERALALYDEDLDSIPGIGIFSFLWKYSIHILVIF